MSKEDEKTWYSYSLHSDIDTDRRVFNDVFNGISALADLLEHGEEKNLEELVLNIRSDGGNNDDMFALINVLERIKKQGVKVTTVANSGAYSAGFYIFIVGDERRAYRNTTFLPHYGSSGDIAFSERDKKETRKETDRSNRMAKNLIKKYTNVNDKTIKEWWNNEVYLTVTQGKKYGFVDKII